MATAPGNPPDVLCLQKNVVQWNVAAAPWVDVLEFEKALEAGELDAALELYAGPFCSMCTMNGRKWNRNGYAFAI